MSGKIVVSAMVNFMPKYEGWNEMNTVDILLVRLQAMFFFDDLLI